MEVFNSQHGYLVEVIFWIFGCMQAMKTMPQIIAVFLIALAWNSGLFCSSIQAQNINLYSISQTRQALGDNGYTLNGKWMNTSARAKLLNPFNFGPQGIYPKSIAIVDTFGTTGSLEETVNLPYGSLFYFGFFNILDWITVPFSESEIDSLYNWSRRGGKLIIASGQSGVSVSSEILNAKWAYRLRNLDLIEPNYFYFTAEGYASDLFDGPFGWPNINLAQGGILQSYFYTLPPSHKVLLKDNDQGRPIVIMDCKTLDLILADVDIFTHLQRLTNLPDIINDQDKFWANTIVFMDKLQDPPILIRDNNSLSVNSNYLSYQWYRNDIAIPGANSNQFVATESGKYEIEVTVNGGCRIKSDTYFTSDVDPNNSCEIFVPTAYSPDQNTVNDQACVYGKCIAEMEFRIFSRWGELLFVSNDPETCWDGTYKGQKLGAGVYAWSLKASLKGGNKVEKKGHLSLVR